MFSYTTDRVTPFTFREGDLVSLIPRDETAEFESEGLTPPICKRWRDALEVGLPPYGAPPEVQRVCVSRTPSGARFEAVLTSMNQAARRISSSPACPSSHSESGSTSAAGCASAGTGQ